MRRQTRVVVWLLLTLIVAAGAWALLGQLPSKSDGVWARVERRDLVIEVAAEGELQAVESVDLGPPGTVNLWSGFKISFMIPEGTEVQAGMPVLRFDVTDMQRQLHEKIAERDSAEKELEKKGTDLEVLRRDLQLSLAEAEAKVRRQELLASAADTGTVALRKLEQARVDRRLAERELAFERRKLQQRTAQQQADLGVLSKRRDRAAVEVQEIERQIGRMTVKAPRAGTVIYRTDWRGDKHKVGDSVWRGLVLLQIPNLQRMIAVGQVYEADAGRLRAGQRARIRLDAYPDREYPATIQRIHSTVQAKSWRNPRKVIRLELELDTTDTERMRPGMRFRGDIEVSRVSDTLLLPLAAIEPRPEGAWAEVATLLSSEQRQLQLGQRNSEQIEVLAGLSEGERVRLRGVVEGDS